MSIRLLHKNVFKMHYEMVVCLGWPLVINDLNNCINSYKQALRIFIWFSQSDRIKKGLHYLYSFFVNTLTPANDNLDSDTSRALQWINFTVCESVSKSTFVFERFKRMDLNDSKGSAVELFVFSLFIFLFHLAWTSLDMWWLAHSFPLSPHPPINLSGVESI